MSLEDKITQLTKDFNDRKYLLVINDGKKILKEIKSKAHVSNLVGLAYYAINQYKLAILYFKKAIKVESKNITFLNNLANSLRDSDQFDKAEFFYKKILITNPKSIETLFNYANLKIILNDYDKGIYLLKETIQIIEKTEKFPDNQYTNVLFITAKAYQAINDINSAKNLIKKILIINPKHTSAHRLFSELLSYSNHSKEVKNHISDLETLIEDPNLSEKKKIDLYFAAGKANNDIENFDKAFFYYDIGNRLKDRNAFFDMKSQKKLVDNIMLNFNKIDLKEGRSNKNPKNLIFVCGIPRSGTTLVHQIISSHSQVYGAGELSFLTRILMNNELIFNYDLNISKIKNAIKSEENLILEEYLNKLNFFNFSENIVVDKAPFNFLWIGFIKIFFPKSKIIHIKRNPKDTCLSLYKNIFSTPIMNWTYSEENIFQYFRLHNRLMKFWNSKISNLILNINYEDLIKNKTTEIKKILNFCNLNWEERCISPEKNKFTAIKTASSVQARKIINANSINSFTQYDKYLYKLFSLVENNL